MTLTDLADSGEHDALHDDELVARLGPPPSETVFYLNRDPAARAAGWLTAVLASLVLWFLIGLAVLLAVD